MSQIFELNDEQVEQLDGISSSFFSNALLGTGNEAYDIDAADQITAPQRLTDYEVFSVYRNSKIARNIVDTFPLEASFGSPTFSGSRYKSYGADPESLKSFISDSLDGADCESLETLFRKASISARLLGVSYLVLGFDDGQSFDQELDIKSIKSFDWLILKNKFELIPDQFIDTEFYTFTNTYYNSRKEAQLLESRVHQSRVLKFTATNDSNEILNYSLVYDSVLQSCIKDLIRDDKGLSIANQMLLKKATLWARLKITQAVTSDLRRNNLQERLRYINLVSSIYRMIGLNTDEELGANQIDVGNVDKILSANVDRLIASSGLNRFKILGTPSSEGLGNSSSGLENRLDFAQRSHSFSNQFWKNHLKRIYKLFCLLPNSPTQGRIPKGLDVNFPPNLILFPYEISDLRKKNCEWAVIAIQAKLLSEIEVRKAFFAATDLESQLVPNIVLDEAFTSQLSATVDEAEMSDLDCQIDEDYQETQDALYLVFHRPARTTSTVVNANSASEAKSKANQKHNGKYPISGSRLATADEITQINKGVWIRTRSDGSSPANSNQKSQIRSHFFKDSAIELFCNTEDEEELDLQIRDSGEIFSDKNLYYSCLAETKSKFAIYPSAYANGYLTKIYKSRYQEKHGSMTGAFNSKNADSLADWFKANWVSIDSAGNITGDCGSDTTQGKVKCLPRAKAEKLSKEERALLVKRKQSQDPNPDRSGSPINVSSHIEDEAIAVDQPLSKKLLSALELLADTDQTDIGDAMEELTRE